ncbi:MAG: DUF3179 domain-containing (seleno)protein [Woeseiaceae bacterium]|nr:DUF3179 domain-containing (seleno)protein [Woeseiaceae bacterium]
MTDVIAIIAVLLTALAVLPGTLGILMLTNRIAASPAGARYIYSQSGILIVAAIALSAYALYRNATGGTWSLVVVGSAIAVGLLLVYGFLMHAKLLFRPVTEPKFIPIKEAIEKFGPDEEVVGVIDRDGKPFAFIARLARRPHIVYQPDGESPFIMTHCILAHSSMSYALEGNFSNPDITITAALANNMVFYEKSNRCSVVQIHNRLEGRNEPLPTVPTVMTSLRTWKRLYPESPVWTRSMEWRDTFYLKMLARADVIDPASPVMVYPLQREVDKRLPMKSFVLGLYVDGEARAYPTELVAQHKVINDRLGDTPLAIICEEDFMQVYDRRVVGATLTFEQAADGFTDSESGSTWSVTGFCTAGKHEGTQLVAIPHYNKIFWFVWSDYFPNCEIYGEPAGSVQPEAA